MNNYQTEQWKAATIAKTGNYSLGVLDAQARASAFMEALYSYKNATTPQDDYEALRERYVNGEIDLEEFAASVVAILKRGL